MKESRYVVLMQVALGMVDEETFEFHNDDERSRVRRMRDEYTAFLNKLPPEKRSHVTFDIPYSYLDDEDEDDDVF